MYNEIHSGNYHTEVKKYTHLRIPETDEEKERREADYVEMKSRTPLFSGIKGMLENLHSKSYILVLNTNTYSKNCLPLLENLKIKNPHLIVERRLS